MIRATEIKNLVVEFLKEYESENYTAYSILKNDSLLNCMYATVEDGKVLDIIHSYQVHGLTVLSPLCILGGKYLASTVQSIRECFGKGILISISFCDVEQYGLYWCNLESTVAGYDYHSERDYCVLNQDEINMLRDRIEEKYMPGAESIDRLSFSLIGPEGMDELMENNSRMPACWRDEDGGYSRTGFHYLVNDLTDCHKLLVAKLDGVVVGAIKYGRYYEDIEKMKHYGINYIDVNVKYRGMGIAKRLIHELSQCIGDDLPIVLSHESPMGKDCKMEGHFKKETWKTKIYTASEWENH